MSLGDDVFDGLPEHDTLRVLDLNMAGVRAAHMEALGGWGALHALATLRVSSCGMGDDGLAALTDVIRPSSALRTLELHGCGVTDIGVNQRFTQALRGLERLRLSSNALGEEAIVALTSNTWPTLQALDLGFCGLKGEQIEALARGLDRFEALGSLSLQDDEVGDEGVIAIMDAMPPTLTHLHLPSAGITDAGAMQIAAHPRLAQLRRLVLSGNTIGADAQLELYISPHNATLDIKFG
jgi:Ran GTPase-activating protein (RanGAP) involved in mRNA processing and transport